MMIFVLVTTILSIPEKEPDGRLSECLHSLFGEFVFDQFISIVPNTFCSAFDITASKLVRNL